MSSVLVVQPDTRVALPLEEAIAGAGHEVRVVDSGERAIDAFVQKPYAAVVVDLDLPGRDGAATIESLRWAPGGQRARLVLTGTMAEPGEVAAVAAELGVEAVPDAAPERVLQVLEDLGGKSPAPPHYVLDAPFDDDLDAPDPAPPRPSVRPTSGDPTGAREGRDVERRAEALAQAARLEGELAATPFPFILARLGEQRASGALVLRSAGDPRATTTGDSPKKVVFFRNGIPVHVRSNLESECLGQLLVRRGIIDRATLEESLLRVRDGDGRQGGILIAMGAITPRQLRDALELQQREKLFDLFAWPGGAYHFSEAMEPPPETVTLEMGLAEMLYRGIRERIPLPRVVQRLEAQRDRFVVPGGRGFFGLLQVVEPAERALLEGVEGRHTLGALLDAAPRRGEAARVLHAARCLGAIGLREAPTERRTDEGGEEDDDGRRLLARVVPLLRAGRWAEALGVEPTDPPAHIARVADAMRQTLRALAHADDVGRALREMATETVVRLARAEAILVDPGSSAEERPPSSTERPLRRAPTAVGAGRPRSEEHPPLAEVDAPTRELPSAAALPTRDDEIPSFDASTRPVPLAGMEADMAKARGESGALGSGEPTPSWEEDATDVGAAGAEQQDTRPPPGRRTGDADDSEGALSTDDEPTSEVDLDVGDAEGEEVSASGADLAATGPIPPDDEPGDSTGGASTGGVSTGGDSTRHDSTDEHVAATGTPSSEDAAHTDEDLAATGPIPPDTVDGEVDLAATGPIPPDAPDASTDDLGPTEASSSVGASPDEPVDLDQRVDRVLAAERHFRRGHRALGRGSLASAERAFARAAELVPSEGEFTVYLGWTRHLRALDADADDALAAALALLEQGCQAVPQLARGHLFRARALRRAGRLTDARNAYERALAADPELDEALTELRELD